MSAGVGILDLRQSASEVAPGVAALRMFLGYAGWTAGQLEQELAEDAWFVVDVDHGDIFTGDPDRLWHRVLRRQPGKLAMFAYFPEDPTQN
jgi:putative transcriptional regulator